MKKKALILSGVHWDSPWQRHHIVSERLVEAGYSVDFVGGIITSKFTLKKLIKKLFIMFFAMINKVDGRHRNRSIVNVISAFYFPPGICSLLFDSVSKKMLLRQISSSYDLVVVYTPRRLTYNLLKEISCQKVVYDCVRDFSVWEDIGQEVCRFELRLLSIVDAVWCDSNWIERKLTCQLNGLGRELGVNKIYPTLPREIFNSMSREMFHHPNIKSVLYFGSFSDHVDIKAFDVIHSLGYEINFIGVSDVEIPCYINKFGYTESQSDLFKKIIDLSEVIIIPYSGNMDGVIPSKLMLSLASGRKVVISSFYDSRCLVENPELFGSLFVYESYADLVSIFSSIGDSEPVEQDIRYERVKGFLTANLVDRFDKFF